MRGRLALDRGIGRENQLLHASFGEDRLQLARPELLGPDAIERREMPHEHEVQSAVAPRLLHGDHVGWGLDDAQQ